MSIHQLIRVPISGPSPYNTLVYIGGTLDWVGSLEPIQLPEMGKTGRGSYIYQSKFSLHGYDSRTSPDLVPHSTTVWMDTFGPQENCNFQASVDAVRYAGFDPDPKNPDPNIGRNGSFYFVVDIAWNLSKGLGANCKEWGWVNSGPPNNTLVQVCTLYGFPFTFQVSSYVLVYEPPPQQSPAGWGRTSVGNQTARTAAAKLADGMQVRRILEEKYLRQGTLAASAPPASMSGGKSTKGCKCE